MRTIKDYTTEISAYQTIAEIQKLLAQNGATGIAMEYDDKGQIKSLYFRLNIDGKELPFKLPAKPQEIYNVLFKNKQGEWKYRDQRWEKSVNIAWRVVLDWLKIQITLINLKQAEVGEIFFPYLSMGEKTLYQIAKDSGFTALPSGGAK